MCGVPSSISKSELEFALHHCWEDFACLILKKSGAYIRELPYCTATHSCFHSSLLLLL